MQNIASKGSSIKLSSMKFHEQIVLIFRVLLLGKHTLVSLLKANCSFLDTFINYESVVCSFVYLVQNFIPYFSSHNLQEFVLDYMTKVCMFHYEGLNNLTYHGHKKASNFVDLPLIALCVIGCVVWQTHTNPQFMPGLT